jgi:hypothetical protein
MRRATFCAVLGLALLVIGGLWMRSFAQTRPDSLALISVFRLAGLVLVLYSLFYWLSHKAAARRRRRNLEPSVGDLSFPSVDASVHSSSDGTGGDCGHVDAGGGDGGACGGDSGGSHH